MPEISNFYGIIIYMFPQEHNPPHFHVKYNEFKASIDIRTGTIYWDITSQGIESGVFMA